jgi:Tfp pilus assembly protein PilF
MQKSIVTTLATIVMLFTWATASFAQGNKATAKKDDKKLTMTWTTKSPAAKELASKASEHMRNIELEQAYYELTDALKLDPDFTVALVFMSNLSAGEVRKAYAARALKSAANKTEGEKLFASLVDEKGTPDIRRATWAKLHTMFPDGGMIGHYYVITRATPEERFKAAEDYIKQFPDEAPMYNIMAYYYMQDKKDNAMAKKYFDKYLSLHPNGPNSYDSMAEYYLTTGDTTNAEKYYKLALEKYPFFNSSVNALQKINDAKPKKEGN